MASSKRANRRQIDGPPPPPPFKEADESLAPFYETLSKQHVYIAHIDTKPRDFKRKIFLVPILMNIIVVALFVWRLYYIGPYYMQLLVSTMGYANETTLVASELSWGELVSVVLRRTLTFALDFALGMFIWPWPVEFCFGRGGNPVNWRWNVGFRDKEIYVRRSRAWFQRLGDAVENVESRAALLAHVKLATSPMLLQQKTGYLTMNGEWDLDWGAMCQATSLVDKKTLALDAFRLVVLVHSKDHGWVCLDNRKTENSGEDERRRQVFAFRDALASAGKEDLFYRWIEMVQFETTQPGGLDPEKQTDIARKVRELFHASGIDFDQFWKENVGSEVAGIM